MEFKIELASNAAKDNICSYFRWINHLDDRINKAEWSMKQEKLMFEQHQKHGNKWTVIAKEFNGRTDNDIKNHFYSMLRRSLRRINKLLGMRNSTKKIRTIKPSVLSNILVSEHSNSQNEYHRESCKRMSETLFEYSRTKSNQKSQSLNDDEKKRLQELITNLLNFNQEYDAGKQQKKSQKCQIKEENYDETELKQRKSSSLKKIDSNKSLRSPPKKIIRRRSSAKSRLNRVTSQLSIQSNNKKQEKESKKTKKIKKFPKIIIPQPQKTQIARQQQNQMEDHSNHINLEFPELQIPHPNLTRESSFQLKRIVSTGQSFDLGNLSPAMNGQIFGRTPQQPTPNLLMQYIHQNCKSYGNEFTNNEELDSIVLKTKMSIEKKNAL